MNSSSRRSSHTLSRAINAIFFLALFAALPSVSLANHDPNFPCAQLTQRLSFGVGDSIKNGEVSVLQQLLSKDSEVYPEHLISGFFGALTDAAVKRFQEKYSIAFAGEAGYGRVGPLTRAKLYEACLSPSVSGTAAPASVSGILVNSPNGGEVWVKGRRATVRWSSDAEAGSRVQITLRDTRFPAELGSGEAVIAASVPNTGSYEFTVPASLGNLSGGALSGSNYKVLVYSWKSAGIADMSDGLFAIADGASVSQAPTTVSTPVSPQDTLVDVQLSSLDVEKLPWPRGLGDNDVAWAWQAGGSYEGCLKDYNFAPFVVPVDPSLPGVGGYRYLSWKEKPRLRVNYMNVLTYTEPQVGRTACSATTRDTCVTYTFCGIQPPSSSVPIVNGINVSEVKDYVKSSGVKLNGYTLEFTTASGQKFPMKFALGQTETAQITSDIVVRASAVGTDMQTRRLADGSLRIEYEFINTATNQTTAGSILITPRSDGRAVTFTEVIGGQVATHFVEATAGGSIRVEQRNTDDSVRVNVYSPGELRAEGERMLSALSAPRINRVLLFALSFLPFGFGSAASAVSAFYMIDDAAQRLGFKTTSQIYAEAIKEMHVIAEHTSSELFPDVTDPTIMVYSNPKLMVGVLADNVSDSLSNNQSLSLNWEIALAHLMGQTLVPVTLADGTTGYAGQPSAATTNFGSADANFNLAPEADVQAP